MVTILIIFTFIFVITGVTASDNVDGDIQTFHAAPYDLGPSLLPVTMNLPSAYRDAFNDFIIFFCFLCSSC